MNSSSKNQNPWIKISKQLIPAPFVCPGCSFSSWSGICESCLQSIRLNSGLLASSTSMIEGFAPLLYSFESTHALVKHWKARQGSRLNRTLFRIAPELKTTLQNLQFDAVVPVPQSFERSWRRGHASAKKVAEYFSKELSVPIVEGLELKNDSNPRQAALTQFEREFAGNPFHLASEVNDRHYSRILLVDDLITSGNTLIRASEELKFRYPNAKIWAGSLAFRPKRTQMLQ